MIGWHVMYRIFLAVFVTRVSRILLMTIDSSCVRASHCDILYVISQVQYYGDYCTLESTCCR